VDFVSNYSKGAIVDNPVPPDPNPQEFAGPLPSVLPVSPRRNPVLFNDEGLRSGWRLLIYVLLVGIFTFLIGFLARKLGAPTRGVPPPSAVLVQELLGFAVVFGCALIMSRFERRSPGDYGLPLSDAFGKKFWLGMLLGLVEISVLIGLISAFGGYSFGSIALSQKGILGWGLLHLVLFTAVGFFEEFTFRGYTQFTLADGVGFWPAALILSLGFGAVHLGNPGEGPIGAASVALVGSFFAFTLYRTGNLWYAVGLHASFDWGETYLFSVPNSGTFMEGHLSNSILHGAKWLTGGTVGPEGSVFCFLTMGLQFLVVMSLFPKKDEPAGSAAPAAPPHTT
jgi:membrane protease YdiL (CAAX protease family)